MDGDRCDGHDGTGGRGESGFSGWRAATERALYGPGGFFLREAPGAHFRTSVHASALFAEAVTRLLLKVDAALGHPEELTLVDVGAGRGELLAAILPPADRAGLARRLRPCAVERAPRPAALDPRIEWRTALPPPGSVTGLLFANEWLDNVPVEVAETGSDGVPRLVLVREDGTETLGGPLCEADAAWLAEWWPLAPTEVGPVGGQGSVPGSGPEAGPEEAAGLRAEIGRPRDAAWAEAVRVLDAGLAVAVDYAHTRAGRPPFGTLTGYLDGAEVLPVPDGSCDITAHVALDACAAAVPAPSGAESGAESVPVLLTQREALHRLGVHGRRPPLAQASTDPAGYVRALSAAGEAAELTDAAGLGAFSWLCHPVALPGGPLP